MTNKRLVRDTVNRKENTQPQAASGTKQISFENVLKLCDKPNNGEIRSKYIRPEFAKRLGIKVSEIVGLQRQIQKLKGLKLRFPQLGRRPNISLIG